MHVFHPAQTNNGFPPENVFLLADDFDAVIGQGHLVRTHHPYLFPERPINIFLSISTRGPGREMLLGALLARAIQLHQQTPYLKARVFAQVGMDDASMLSLYMDSGFEADDALDIIKIQMPPAKPSAPLGYDMGFIPLQSSMEQASFLMRMNMYRLDLLTQPILRQYMSMQHFIALYIARGSEIVGEIAMTGQGDTAQIVGLYVSQNYRKLGLAKTLIAAAMSALKERGVTTFLADAIRRNQAQSALAQSCQATFVRTACLYPGINYD